MRWKALRLGVVATVLVALFISPAAAAGNKYPADPTCQTNGVVRSILYLNGTVYLAGDFTQLTPAGETLGGPGTVTRDYLAACSESTGAILPWNPGANGRVMSLATDGTNIYAGGKFTTLAGQPRSNIGALTTAGVATSFNPGAAGEVFVVRIGPNGNIFAGGSFSKLGGKTAAKIGEVTPAGKYVSWPVTVAQVTGFACPPRCPPEVFTIAFSGNTVYFGGHFGLVNGISRNSAAAVDLTTGSVLAWNPSLYAPANCPTCKTTETERAYTIIPDPTTNLVYICGGFWSVNWTSTSHKTAYNLGAFDPTTGALSTAFTVQDDGDTPGCAIQNGIIYFGGHFNYVGVGCQHTTSPPCYVYHHIAAADLATNTVETWNPGANSNHGIYTVSEDPTHVGFGGYQTTVAGHPQGGYASWSSTLP
jgi:hypothetical protein